MILYYISYRRRIFAEITFYATDENGAGLKANQYIGATAPTAHCILDSVGINVGECALESTPRYNGILTKLTQLLYYSKSAKETILR